ncbi:MAG: VWA domain-containing protein [Pirellulaceae bacterium]
MRLLNSSFICALLFVLCTESKLLAQEGVSSLAMGRSRAGLFPAADEFRIEEVINYHRHRIDTPSCDERISLTLESWPRKNKTVYQVSLATPSSEELSTAPPLNLTLVIDCSGSMSGDRIQNVKRSLVTFSEQLRDDDTLSLVTYNSEARVVISPCQKANVGDLVNRVESLVASQRTNLHDGLRLGLEQNADAYIPSGSNRVILLTDGIANEGVTTPEQIADMAQPYFDQGINLSCIGLGHDLNHQLLRELSDAGHGLIHFIDDAQDIEKTFVKEAKSLLTPIARNVELTIELPVSAQSAKVFGYQPSQKGKKIRLTLDDLNAGATQVVLFELPNSPEPLTEVCARLRFTNAISSDRQEVVAQLVDQEKSVASDIRKNYAIATLATGIKEALEHLGNGNPNEDSTSTLDILNKHTRRARRIFSDQDDVDFQRVLKIVNDMSKACSVDVHVRRRQ